MKFSGFLNGFVSILIVGGWRATVFWSLDADEFWRFLSVLKVVEVITNECFANSR
jgi:hypothetical protein